MTLQLGVVMGPLTLMPWSWLFIRLTVVLQCFNGPFFLFFFILFHKCGAFAFQAIYFLILCNIQKWSYIKLSFTPWPTSNCLQLSLIDISFAFRITITEPYWVPIGPDGPIGYCWTLLRELWCVLLFSVNPLRPRMWRHVHTSSVVLSWLLPDLMKTQTYELVTFSLHFMF